MDRICLEFEDAWRQGESPSIRDYWLRGECEDRKALLVDLLEVELVYRRQNGDSPQCEEYLALFPEYPEAVREAFAWRASIRYPSDPLQEGTCLGRYRIIRRIGQGAFGTVYLAQDEQLERQVALKIPGNGMTASTDQIQRLIEETRAAGRLRHPAIVAVYDVQTLSDGRMFAVMEYVEGCTLRQFMNRPHHHDVWAGFFAELAEALAYAHAQGFIHRDLDPENILVDPNGHPHITDFGLAIHEAQQPGRSGERAGSWAYMSPEQVRGESHRMDGRADLWAIGVMLYECLTGRRPFQGESSATLQQAILQHDPKPPRQIRPDIPSELEAICLKCLNKNVQERWSSAAQLAEALRRSSATRPERSSRRAMLLAIPTAAFIAATAWWLTNRRRSSTDQEPLLVKSDLLVWRNGQWYSIRNPWITPLRHGDLVRIQVACRPSQFLYAFWQESTGKTAPLYPWQAGQWDRRGKEAPLERLVLPSNELDWGWPMHVDAAGHEWLLIGCRADRLADTHGLTAALMSLRPLPLPNQVAVVLTPDNVQYLFRPRGMKADTPRQIDDPVLNFHRSVRQRLEPYFHTWECFLVPAVP